MIAPSKKPENNGIMPRKRPDTTHETAPPCTIAGCGKPGAHRCPKSPRVLHEYVFLCTDHAREHNQKWNYFEGFSEADFERYYQESRLGHRPTWAFGIGPGAAQAELRAAMERFLNQKTGVAEAHHRIPDPLAKPLTPQERKAIHLLGFDTLPEQADLKRRYKELAKLYHPDVNKGASDNEERLKEVNFAYSLLKKRIASS
jgi:hypothetical protein